MIVTRRPSGHPRRCRDFSPSLPQLLYLHNNSAVNLETRLGRRHHRDALKVLDVAQFQLFTEGRT